MNGPHAQQWAHIIQGVCNSLETNEIWTLVAENDVEQGHKPLSENWVFRIKRDVNRVIARFKVR